jgi:hypothetical protein
MTAMAADVNVSGVTLRVVSLAGAQRRLGELLSDRRGRVQWWVELTRYLDELSASLNESAEELDTRRGLADQIRRDAPHLLGKLRRLDGERDRIATEVNQVRLLAGDYAGDPMAVNAVSRAVRELMWRVRRYQEKSTEMLLDAYARDMGGE